MKTKGYLLNILRLNNGIRIKLFSLFLIGVVQQNEGFGPYFMITFGIYKLEFGISLTWRERLYGNQKNKKTNQQESETPLPLA